MAKQELERRMKAVNSESAETEPQEAQALAGERMEGPEGVYRTQREIDAAIGRRLHQEREKWERQHAAALLLERAMGEQNPQEAVALLLARGNGLEELDVSAAMGQGTSMEEILDAARRNAMQRKAQEMARSDPEFALESAMQNPAFRALVEAGEPMEKAYAYLHMEGRMEDAKQEAREEVLRQIQDRRTRPAALRPASGYAMADGGQLPDSVMRMIDARLKRGERVDL